MVCQGTSCSRSSRGKELLYHFLMVVDSFRFQCPVDNLLLLLLPREVLIKEDRGMALLLGGIESWTVVLLQREALEKKLSETRQQLTEIKSTWSDKISHLEEQVRPGTRLYLGSFLTQLSVDADTGSSPNSLSCWPGLWFHQSR